MKGAIAAGHPLTAEAGARVLAEGGNAVDACIAASFASWVTESPLTGPGAGGFMLVHRAADRSTRVFDCFVAVPGLGAAEHERTEMEAIDVRFTGSDTTQVFRIGTASCAVPGLPAGLDAAHRAFGTLPWKVLLEPGVELARAGVDLTRPQAHLHAILDSILRHTDEGRRLYGRDGRLVAGERLLLSDLATTLERLPHHGADDFYRGELARLIVEHVQGGGGELTDADLAAYRVVRRRPVSARYRGHEFLSNPPPSSGGVLIGFGLRLLDRLGGGAPGTAEAMSALVEVMRQQTRIRGGRFAGDLYRGGLASRLGTDEAVDDALRRIAEGRAGVPEPTPAGGTTHISVVDARGNAASLSASTGSGSGVIVPGTGIHMNNMLGEYDLAFGLALTPGRRMTSMMSPSIALGPDGPRLVVGSAGSVRLRGAIMQIAVNVLGHGMGVERAIAAPRVPLDEPHVHCEGGADPDEVDRLEALGYDVVRWRRRNLFFGGASGVERLPDGSLAAAGDPRRGGHGVVVERA